MAAMWALVTAHILLLLPVLRASVEFELHGNVYPDGGSTYTSVHKTTLARLIDALDTTLKGSSLTKVDEVEDPALPVCWKDREPIQSFDDVRNNLYTLDLTFSHGDNQATLEIPPENYMILMKNGNVCLGIHDGSAAGLGGIILIGANAMQNHIIVYDNERARIGWVRASCDGHEPLIGSRL